MKKVTILMSTYNGEKYIKEQIESILNQSYENIDLIVRDDGSSDSTIDILEEYSMQGKLKWYGGDTNLKPAYSFLELVRNASDTDFYAFADQDDVWDREKIEVAINYLEPFKQQTPILYCSTTKLVDQNLNEIAPIAYNKSYRLSFGESLVQSVSPGCTFVFNYSLKKHISNFKGEDIIMHDSLAYKLACGLGQVVFDKQPHISYRQHGGNVIGNETSFIKKNINRMKRFMFPRVPNSRLRSAIALKKNYGDIFDEKTLITLNLLINYKSSFLNKLKLIRNKDIQMVNGLDNFFLKILILLGKV
ncbi:glycosyltransferase family 2 protein [Psychrobacillus sp. MER TA 171]|uniref:glycosyltransferase family 2 protein n=1 Tax=Psychrobacillus sp. MER TA 171 TaxID=2939577 RepID=UPI00203DDEEA|nr:glycosyltransferase family 2 protein [Psychrobacillus sp. MER TA 171]MCM3356560.1 glycosyltransferase family 2 protein [Psychrobacillus sp. MER TA 171]